MRSELGSLDQDELTGGENLVARLELELDTARRKLLDALNGDSYRALLTRLCLPPRLAPDSDAIPLRRIARKEFRRLLEAVDRLGKHPDDAAIHRLRIKLKRARYAAELSAPKGKAGRRFIDEAKRLQDLLGEHQDAIVAEHRLREATVGDAQTAAAFVAGRLAERQRARRAQVAERLPAAWKRLRKRGAQLG